MASESQAIGHSDIGRVGKRGAIVIPARLRRRFGIEEGSLITAEERAEGILIRPAVAVPVEIYSPVRRAALLLSNAADEKEYREIVREVEAMGLDPARIEHHKPRRRRR